MESTEELQQQEITALKSIYGDDFQEVPAPKAWKVCLCPRFFPRLTEQALHHRVPGDCLNS